MNKKNILRYILLEPTKSLEHIFLNGSFLFLRVSAALTMLFAHGIGKWVNFSSIAPKFSDPFGFLGSSLSLALVVGSEVFGAILMALGLFTRFASFSLFFTMAVAFFIVDASEPFDEKELAFMYGIIYLFFTFTGGGKYSVDHLLKRFYQEGK